MALELDFSHPLRSFVAALRLSVPRGTTTALVGPSGAGKTTVLRVVAGLLEPREGMLTVDGVSWLDTSRGHRLPPERRRVGYLFQEYALFPHLDVSQNVRFGARDSRLADEMLDRFGITHLRHARTARSLRWRAPAGRPRASPRTRPRRAPARRAAVLPGRPHEDRCPARATPTPSRPRPARDCRHARLRGRRGARRHDRRHRRGTAPPDRYSGRARHRPRRPVRRDLHRSDTPARNRRRHSRGPHEVLLDSGATTWSTQHASGRVQVAVYPWDVTLAREQSDSSLNNHLRGPITSIVPIGDRTRVRVGPIVAEITGASARRLELTEGDLVIASFKATAARLLPASERQLS